MQASEALLVREKAGATSLARTGRVVTVVGLTAMVSVYVRALMYTPPDATQGLAQKIFYIHAPAAISALLAFVVTGLASVFYLWLKDARLDLFAAASAEVGVVFSVIMLTTGPIWAKPIWGAWWTWDTRLSSTLFMFLLFVGYLVLRRAVQDPVVRGRYSSVLGIMGMLLVPFIHLTVYLFRTQHPDPVVLKPGAPSMPSVMFITFVMGVLANLILYAGFAILSYAASRDRELRLEEVASA